MADKKKLEKEYDEANSKNKTLEEQENVVIEKYMMKEGNYKILITIYEANDLIPGPADFFLFNAEKSACDAFVEIEILGEVKRTPVRKETNNPIWQEPFYFQFENMSVQDLDRAKIVFNVYDKNHLFIRNSHVGQFEADWTNIYFRRFHEIYRGWLTLSDPSQTIEGPVGYLLVNVAVLGPEDKVVVHDSAFIKDPLTTIEDTITNLKTPLIDYSLTVEVFRGENLLPLDLASRSVDAYVVAKFSGNKVKTSSVSSLNPEWNQALKIASGVPNKTKYITLEVWNHNLFSKDDLIGVIKVPFIDVVEEKYVEPRWGHLYGPPMCAVDEAPRNYATKMQLYGQEIGSHYRGRIMFKVVGKKYVHSTTAMNKLQFKFPFKPTPVVPLKTYTLSVELIEGFRLPDYSRFFIHVGMGQHMTKSQSYQMHERCGQFFQILADKKIEFAEDVSQVPDIIIYLATGRQEKDRICFVRIKAADVATKKRHQNSKIYELEGDKSLNLLRGGEIGGYLTCAVNLYTDVVPAQRAIESDYKLKQAYDLMFYLYKGQGFPPANIQGDCDPMMRFSCESRSADSKPIKGSFNPFWNQSIKIEDVHLQDIFSTNITKGVVCQALDWQQNGKHQFIGSFIIEINSSLITKIDSAMGKGMHQPTIIYKKPRWYYVKNPHVQIGKNIFGRVLMSVALFKKSDIKKRMIPLEYLQQQRDSQFFIPTEEKLFQVYLIGLRDIKDSGKKMIQKGTANVKMNLVSQTMESGEVNIKQSGCEINKLVQAKIKIPKNKRLTPYLDFKVMHNGSFYGFNSVSLYHLLPKLQEKQDPNRPQIKNEDSEETILDVENLQAQLDMIKEKRKMDKLNELQNANEKRQLQDLKAPFELGLVTMKEQYEDPEQMDKLINNFQSQLDDIDNTDWAYIREMEKRRDNLQKKRNEANMIRENLLSEMELPAIQQEEDEKSKLAPSELSIPIEKGLGASARSKDESNIRGTIFDRIRQKSKNGQSRVAHSANILGQLVKQNQKEEQVRISNGSEHLKSHSSQEAVLRPRSQRQKERQQQEGRQNIAESEVNVVMERDHSEHSMSRLSQLEVDKQSQVRKLNSEASVRDHYYEASNRFSAVRTIKDPKKGNELDEQEFHIELRTEQNFSQISATVKAIRYKDVERVMEQELKDEKEAQERDAEYKFAQAVKLTLFGWNRKKKKGNIETYEDYDTQEGEDLDIVPEWYKGRKILTSDFEDLNFKGSKIKTIPLFGGKKVEDSIFHQKGRDSAGHIKMIVMSENTEYAHERDEYYTKLLKQKEYYCRIYILKGKSLISGYDVKPSTYLKFTYSDETTSLRSTTYVEEETNPEYYICHQLPIKLPGPAVIKIEVFETHHIFGKLVDRVLGYTQIDIQQRYFTKRWHLYDKKPIELRNLYSEYGMGTQGRLETFIDLVEKKKWLSTPAHKIAPPPFDPYELRVIVWKTADCAVKNIEMESNDVFVRGVIGTSQFQQTDTHWACRTQGNFNYRFKFPVNYPPKPEDMYSDIFSVQIWDRDLIGYNNLIGETRINLNKIHRIIQKAVKRRKPVKASMRIKEKNFALTERFWFDVTNSRIKDEFGLVQPQGRVQMSFELVPKELAEKELENGYGRSEPNVYPTLPEPQGRLSFDIFDPLGFVKQILGPNLYAKWCCRFVCCILIVLLCVFGYIFFPVLLASVITN